MGTAAAERWGTMVIRATEAARVVLELTEARLGAEVMEETLAEEAGREVVAVRGPCNRRARG